MLTFSKALVLFSTVFTAIYTVMLWSIAKHSSVKSREERLHSRSYFYQSLKIASLSLSAIGLGLTLLADFRETLPYLVILTLIPVLNVLTILYKPSCTVLASFILWHLMMLSDRIPLTGILLGEGMQMVRAMSTHSHWYFEWAHNPSYNPLPTIAFITATVSHIITVEWYNYYLNSLIFLTWAIAYDMAVYLLTSILTNDKRVALLAVPLIAITPEVAIHQHPYQWSGNMLVLLATFSLIKLMMNGNNRSDLLIIAFCFTGAILAHATGIAFLIVITAITLTKILVPVLRKLNLVVIERLLRLKILLRIIVITIVILLIRSLYTYGYVEYVAPPLINVLHGLIDFFREFLIARENMNGGISYHIPLYDRAGVPFIQAYVWSYAVALAIAYLLYTITVRRRVEILYLSLYLSATLMLAIAYVCYALIKERDFYILNRTTYVFIPFLFPLSALALRKTLTLNIKRLRTIGMISLMLFAITSPIAAQDPNISPVQYAKIRHTERVPLTLEDLLNAQFILEHMEYPASWYEFYISSSQLYKIGKYVLTADGEAVGVWLPKYTCELEEAIRIYSFINIIPKPGTTVIALDVEESLHQNLIYNIGDTRVYLSTPIP